MVCAFGVFLSAAPAAAAKLELPFLKEGVRLSVSKSAYWRYEMVEIQADAPEAAALGSGVLEVRIFKDGAPVEGMPGREACLLRWDANLRVWRGRWPIPWNPRLGEYEARLAEPAAAGTGAEHVYFSGPGTTRTARVAEGHWSASCTFTLRGRKPRDLPPGFSVMTLEPGHSGYRFPGPEGGPRTWQNAFSWAQFMGADAFWHCALQTQVWPGQSPEDLPWNRRDLEMIDTFAGEARSRGVGYGAYMLTFLVGGDFKRTDYEFTLGFDRATGGLTPLRFISMADSKRQREIAAAIKRLQATPGVDFIGMDYVRANTGGLEFTDEFLNDLDLEVPEEIRRAGVRERRMWLGRHLAYDSDKRLHDLWDWWRAHYVSLVLKGILEDAHVEKPVWVFSLGWKQGHQHGQDPRMLVDAGISFNAPMFYEADAEQYPAMLSDWKAYLADTGGVLVLGQVVDSKLLHPRPGLNGPEEHLKRHLESLGELGPSVDRLGFFWHDLNRAVAGGRGAEGLREWALAGASSFARLRESVGVVPVALAVSVAGAAPKLSGCVRISNLGPTALDKVRVAEVWTPGLGSSSPGLWWVRDLKAGETRELTFTVAVTPRFVRERFKTGKEERMVAFKAEPWDQGPVGRPDVAFVYWRPEAKAAPKPEGKAAGKGGPRLKGKRRPKA
jgi:hypothetical protein